ncbi:phosphopantetheine-binding protein [Streptomyces sp. NPDC059568]|uniref:phosphopantetheine-binding protein n=1 Tax=Streptomyces sp. NPDC059568 TaxID=3346868 RepID=UPI0036CD085A
MDAEFVAMLRPFLKYAGDKEIAEPSRLRELGLDSMRAIELLFALEDTYGVSVPDEMLTDDTFETGGSLWSMVENLRTATGGGHP